MHTVFFNGSNMCTPITAWSNAVCPHDQVVVLNQSACNAMLHYELVYTPTSNPTSYSCEQTSSGPYGTYYLTSGACSDVGQESYCYSATSNTCVQITAGDTSCSNNEPIYTTEQVCSGKRWYNLSFPTIGTFTCIQESSGNASTTYYSTLVACNEAGNNIIAGEYCQSMSIENGGCVPDIGTACCGQTIFGNSELCIKSVCAATGIACFSDDPATYTCLPSLCYECSDGGVSVPLCNSAADALLTDAAVCTDGKCVCSETVPNWTTYSKSGGQCTDSTCVNCVSSPTGIEGGACSFVDTVTTGDQTYTPEPFLCTVVKHDGITDIMVCPDGTPCTTGLPDSWSQEFAYFCSNDIVLDVQASACIYSSKLPGGTSSIKNQLYNDATMMQQLCKGQIDYCTAKGTYNLPPKYK